MRALFQGLLVAAVFVLPLMTSSAYATLTIGIPKDTSKYGTGATIGVLGSCDSDKVTKVRIQFVSANKVIQETIVPLAGGTFQGMLMPPTGGWPLGKASIQAQGLDNAGNEITGNFSENIIKIE